MNEDSPGNAAAMRAALERIVRYEDGIVGCIESGHASGVDWDGITFAMIQTAKEALAAPARNADRFKNGTEAGIAFRAERQEVDEDAFWPSLVNWLFAPAEGGDHA